MYLGQFIFIDLFYFRKKLKKKKLLRKVNLQKVIYKLTVRISSIFKIFVV